MKLRALSHLHSTAGWAARLCTWSLFLLTFLAGTAGWINPATWALPAMLALCFLPLFILSFTATLAWVIHSYRSPASIAGGVLMALMIYPLLTVCPVSQPKKPRPGERELTVVSYNSFYCNDTEFDNPVRSRTLDYLITSKADIVCLQELYSLDAAGTHGKATQTQIEQVKQLYPYRYEPGDRELVILSRFPITPLHGDNGKLFFQYQAVSVDVNGTPVTVVNVHLPSFGLSDDERQIVRKLREGSGGLKEGAGEMRHTIYGKLALAFAERAHAAEIIRDYADTVKGNLIVCGDFNDVPGSYSYRTIKSAGLRDAYNETATGYTYTYNAYMMFFHIDQMLYRGDMRAVSFRRGTVKSSDHYPIRTTFALPASKSAGN